MKVKRFEDLPIWQDSRSFINMIYKITSNQNFKKDFSLQDQIRRAAVSILNNIAEGFERDSNNEFIKFLVYSKGSAGEVRSVLYIAYDLNYISKDEFDRGIYSSINIICQISRLITYLRNCK